MAKIASSLFGWQEVEAKSDLACLKLVLEYLPDEQLMQDLEAERGRGRNDYPVRCGWNAILAVVVYQHLAKMKARVGIALIVMLAMALGYFKEKRREMMRSLVRSPTQDLTIKSALNSKLDPDIAINGRFAPL